MKSSERKPAPRGSRIWYGLNRVTAWLYALILESAIGRYLTSYRPLEETAAAGSLSRLLHSERKRADRWTFRVCRTFARTLERSKICRLSTTIQRELLRCSLNSYGIFFLFFGCYSVATYYVQYALTQGGKPLSSAIVGGFLILLSLPLFASTRSLGSALGRSIVFRMLLIRGMGIAEERFRSYDEKGKERYLEALLLALIGGALTMVYPTGAMLCVAGVAILIALILREPEIGMLLSVVLCPFLTISTRPTLLLLGMVALTLFSFTVKLLCGKRVLQLEMTDGAIFLLLLLYVLGGLITRGSRASLYSALTYGMLMLMYFMVSQSVRSEEGVRRVRAALLISAIPVALIGLWQYFFADITSAYLDLSLFSDLGGRVYSTWENPNMLAEYLALLLPLFFARGLGVRRPLYGFGRVLCILICGACLVLTWSRGAWLGTLVALLLFLFLLGYRAMSATVLLAIPAVGIVPLLPEQIVRRFASIGNLSDSSIHYRLNLWEGVGAMLREHWITGIGVGEDAFRTVYAQYALPGIETAMHAHSVYLQLLCTLGIFGLIVFGAAMLLWLRRALEFYRYGEASSAKLTVLGGFAGITALLLMGFFDEIFYNYRIFFLFWVVAGLVSAQVRVAERQTERSYNPIDDEKTQGEVTFHFHGSHL